MIHKIVFFISFFIVVNGFAQKRLDKLLKTHNSHSIPYISVDELRMLQFHDSVKILDAREVDEFKVSHIASSKHIGYNNFNPEEKTLLHTSKNTPIIVYCSVGIRSEKIGEKLKKAGFTNVRNLYGGIFEWKNKEFPVVDTSGNETDNIHVYSKIWSEYLHKGHPIY